MFASPTARSAAKSLSASVRVNSAVLAVTPSTCAQPMVAAAISARAMVATAAVSSLICAQSITAVPRVAVTIFATCASRCWNLRRADLRLANLRLGRLADLRAQPAIRSGEMPPSLKFSSSRWFRV